MKSRLSFLFVRSLAGLALLVPACAWSQCTPSTTGRPGGPGSRRTHLSADAEAIRTLGNHSSYVNRLGKTAKAARRKSRDLQNGSLKKP